MNSHAFHSSKIIEEIPKKCCKEPENRIIDVSRCEEMSLSGIKELDALIYQLKELTNLIQLELIGLECWTVCFQLQTIGANCRHMVEVGLRQE
uniref:Uncharacterized protein n=1 Tax=Nelumbo nucifera TaxID=4432 RepID=A0A822ZQ39_NELNU|nr:TPA_asm: hypothetical protein HUJ06_003276 [Nelumbo nucifera]